MMSNLNIIRQASKEQLLDRVWLEGAICKLGLGKRPTEIPLGMHKFCGGLYIWQYPIQLAPYLIELAGKHITSYAEIGLFQGGTFILTVEYLSRFSPITTALGIDKLLLPEVKGYAEHNSAVRLVEAMSTDDAAREAIAEAKPDLVFIDADHSEEACRADYEMVKPHAKYIGFHDLVEWTCPGVSKVWQDAEGVKREYLEQYHGIPHSTYGIGLVENAYSGSDA